MKYYIGIDLGGTNIVAGVVDEDYNIVSKASVKTNCPRPDKEIANDMAKVALKAVEEAKLTIDDIEWIGIGTPGIANSETGIIEYSNNLGFNNTPMVKYIQETIDKPVFIENDANAAAYGEFVAGAAKGAKNAVCITLGTGVGAGVVIDGKKTEPAKLELIKSEERSCLCRIIISEGRNRQVRRMFESVGKEVVFLKRIKIGDLTLSGVDRGKCRPLSRAEIDYLKNL